jgi:hypothetical protein
VRGHWSCGFHVQYTPIAQLIQLNLCERLLIELESRSIRQRAVCLGAGDTLKTEGTATYMEEEEQSIWRFSSLELGGSL